jgi:ABC-type branched-subunit amino acid transport system ATPase component
MRGPVLGIERLTAGYEDAAVVRELDLNVGEGEVVALLGANGAGKTTHVPETRGLFFGLTVAEHFRLGHRRERLDSEAAYRYFPALAELRDRRCGLLSGGEQQMLAVARALARHPKLLLLDELSLGLAPLIVERLLPVVRDYATDTGCGVLLVEQHIQLALAIADRGYVLSRGEIVLHDRAEALRGNRDLLLASYFGDRSAASGAGPSAL